MQLQRFCRGPETLRARNDRTSFQRRECDYLTHLHRIGTAAAGIDESRREEFFRCNEKDKPACHGCALELRCHNKCGCLNIQTTGRLDSIPPALCENERMVFPIVDKLAERLFRSRETMFIQRHYNPAFPILSFLEDLSTP